jgi:hypothetical protein
MGWKLKNFLGRYLAFTLLRVNYIVMDKCSICKRERKLVNCSDCKGTGNASSGVGYCPFCNGERKLCKDCQG